MQIRLSLSSINRSAPYRVDSTNGYSFTFKTRYGYLYEVGFTEDGMLSDDGRVFQFFIVCVNSEHPAKDLQVKDTVISILEEFFKNESVSLVYICDTHDGRQAVRERLFESWFHQYPLADLYEFICKTLTVENTDYYLSFLCRKDNLLLEDRKGALDDLFKNLSRK